MIYGINFLMLSDISDELGTIREKLIGTNVFSFVVQLCATLVLILVVIYFAYKPVKKLLKKRADYIESNITDSEKNKVIAEQNVKQSNDMILASKKEASTIIEKANKEALKQRVDLVEETKGEIKQMKEDAELDIERSRQETLQAVHEEMVSVALAASREILKREVNEKDDAKLAEDFIKKLD